MSSEKTTYNQPHFFVLHPQAIDKPADLFRDNQTLYQGVTAQK